MTLCLLIRQVINLFSSKHNTTRKALCIIIPVRQSGPAVNLAGVFLRCQDLLPAIGPGFQFEVRQLAVVPGYDNADFITAAYHKRRQPFTDPESVTFILLAVLV